MRWLGLAMVMVGLGCVRRAPSFESAPDVACWDGTGEPLLEGEPVAPLPQLALEQGSPARLTFLSDDERHRRARLLERRNPGFVIEVSVLGDLEVAYSSRMPCSTSARAASWRAGAALSEDERRFLAAFEQRNADVADAVGVREVRAVGGAGRWALVVDFAATRKRLAMQLPPPRLSDAQLLERWGSSHLEVKDINVGDSCGPGCGPPPVSVTVLGHEPLSPASVEVVHQVMVAQAPGGFSFRRVASLRARCAAAIERLTRKLPTTYESQTRLERAQCFIEPAPSTLDASSGEAVPMGGPSSLF